MSKSEFVGYLIKLDKDDDRGALASLRRGLGKPEGTTGMYKYVARFLPKDDPWLHRYYFMVASLFALYPSDDESGKSFGKSFREAVSQRDDGGSAEKRFLALLDSEAENLHYHLRSAVAIIAGESKTIDYHRLLADICSWSFDYKNVQRQWALDFWHGIKKENNDEGE